MNISSSTSTNLLASINEYVYPRISYSLIKAHCKIVAYIIMSVSKKQNRKWQTFSIST